MKKCQAVIAVILALMLLPIFVFADEDDEAELIPIKISGIDNTKNLTDGKDSTYVELTDGTVIDITSDVPIRYLYILFDKIPGEWTLMSQGATFKCGKNGFLHEYIDVSDALGAEHGTLSAHFPDGASVSEIYALTDGALPDWVQVWNPPCETADLLLATTHVDDEQLFFAGVLPYFAGEKKYSVQVVYFTSPFKYHDRCHEQLNGLWTVGVRNYPINGEFVDEYSENLDDAYRHQKNYGFTKDDILAFQVEMIRRFKPMVVIGHDFAGEYSHGQHMLNAATLTEAIELASGGENFTESAEKYGVWDTPKTYIHLYEENPIVMDWDVPLESFGGKTAFEMTQAGFMCHKSQHWTWFYKWIYGKDKAIEKATDIKKYSPCKYGLYRTTVGLDSGVGDMFEHIKTWEVIYAEAEESRRIESESIDAEESRRLESKQLAEEESQRLESERLAEEESRRLESERLAEETDDSEPEDEKTVGRSRPFVIIAVGAAISSALIIPQLSNGGKKKKKYKK